MRTITIERTTADEVADLIAKWHEMEDYAKELRQMAVEKAMELKASGSDMTTADGRVIHVNEMTRRQVLPEMVRMRYPELYRQIRDEQAQDFEPRLTIGGLKKHLPDDVLDELTVSNPSVRVWTSEVR